MKKLLYLLTFISSFAFAQTTVRMSATATGTDTYSCLFNPNVAAFNSSTIYVIPFTNANTSGTITLDPDGGGPGAAVSIKGDDGNDLAVGAIKSGGTYQFKFNGTLLRMIGSAGGGGWLTTGTTNLTGDAIVDNGAHNLLIGDLASGPWSYWDMDGSGPVGLANTHISGIGDPLGTEHSFVQESLGVAENGVVLQSSFTGGGLSGISILSSAGASGVNMFASGTSQANAFVSEDGRFGVLTNNIERIHIDNDGSWDLGASGLPGSSGNVLTSNGAGSAPTWQAGVTNTSSALTDGAAITITGVKHTLTSTQATVTWTLSQTQDFQTTDIILNATSTTWTFPAGALCVVDGVASGDNTAALTGTSGDHHIMSIYKDGTNYRVAIKNFGQ